MTLTAVMMKIKGVHSMTDTQKEIKAFYIDAINELVEDCKDLNLLDLIYQILVKSES